MSDPSSSLRGNALSDALNRARNAEATLAEIRQAVGTFIKIRGEKAPAGDLAEAVRQILDREPLEEGYPSTAGMEAAARDLEGASPVAEVDGQIPFPGVAG